MQLARIVKGTPELLASAIRDREAIGIVHCGPEIIEVLAIVWSEEEHAGHGCKSGMCKIHSRIERHLDIKYGGLAGTNCEAIACGGAFAVEQPVNDDGCRFGRRLLQPKRLEYGKLFPLRLAGIDGKTAGGQAIRLALGDRPEVACSKEDADFVVIIRPLDRGVNAEAGESEIEVGPLSNVLAKEKSVRWYRIGEARPLLTSNRSTLFL